MRDVISNCTNTIHKQSTLLIDGNQGYLSLAQQDVINRISHYCTQLMTTAQLMTINSEQEIAQRHELINILTPIVGYIEMLADGWIGQFNFEQKQHLDLIQHTVYHMQREILAYRYQRNLSESA